jgi:hypothetical protein
MLVRTDVARIKPSGADRNLTMMGARLTISSGIRAFQRSTIGESSDETHNRRFHHFECPAITLYRFPTAAGESKPGSRAALDAVKEWKFATAASPGPTETTEQIKVVFRP